MRAKLPKYEQERACCVCTVSYHIRIINSCVCVCVCVSLNLSHLPQMNDPLCNCPNSLNYKSRHYGCCIGSFGCSPYHTPPYPNDITCNPWSNNTHRQWTAMDLSYISNIRGACSKVSPKRSSRLSPEFSGGHQKIQENPGAGRNQPERAGTGKTL